MDASGNTYSFGPYLEADITFETSRLAFDPGTPQFPGRPIGFIENGLLGPLLRLPQVPRFLFQGTPWARALGQLLPLNFPNLPPLLPPRIERPVPNVPQPVFK